MADKCPYSQSYGISRSHVRMWELDYKEGRVMKNWCFWTVVLEKTVASPLDCKEIKPVNPKGKKPWTFIVKTDAEAEAPILCTWCKEPTHWIDWLIGKQPTDAGKDWRQQQKGMTKNEMVGWYHWLIGHEFEKTSVDNWRTGKPGVLQSMGLQRVRHNWATEQQFYKKRNNFSLAHLVKVCQEWFVTHFSKCLHMKYCSILWNDFYPDMEIWMSTSCKVLDKTATNL